MEKMRLIAILCFPIILYAQIPNLGFEKMNRDSSLPYWSSCTFISAGGMDTIQFDYSQKMTGLAPVANSGNYSLAIGNAINKKSNTVFRGCASTCIDSNGQTTYDRNFSMGKKRPDTLYFFYKFLKKTNSDTALFSIQLDNGYGEVKLWKVAANFQQIAVPIHYDNADTPMQASIQIKNQLDNLTPTLGTVLLIDDVSFVKVAGGVGGLTQGVENRFSLFPNPAQNILKVDNLIGTKEYHYEIHDLSGRIVAAGTCSARQSLIEIDYLESGIYTFSLTLDSKEIFSQKWKKE